MYAVVGCGECGALWVLEGRPDTSRCPRCGTTRQFDARREFFTSEDADEARQARASMLASRSDHGAAFEALDSFAGLEAAVAEAGIDDETYLAESGLDVTAIEAVEADESGSGGGGIEGVVRAALRELERPDEEAVVGFAAERGVSREAVERVLTGLRRSGEVTERDGGYRLL